MKTAEEMIKDRKYFRPVSEVQTFIDSDGKLKIS
jgi:hypothetical protein